MKLKSLATKSAQQGFTLVELLVVIGILGIIMAVTIIAINPIQQFQNARNAQRSSDVTTILDGIYEYEASNSGTTPAGLANASTTAKFLGFVSNQTATATSFVNPSLTLTGLTVNPIITAGGSVTISGCSQAGDNGTWPVVSGTANQLVVTDAGGSVTSATGCVISNWTDRVDLCATLVPSMMAAVPMDPSGSSGTQCTTGTPVTYNSAYKIAVNAAGNRYTVSAPSAENSVTISVTR